MHTANFGGWREGSLDGDLCSLKYINIQYGMRLASHTLRGGAARSAVLGAVFLKESIPWVNSRSCCFRWFTRCVCFFFLKQNPTDREKMERFERV